MKLQTTVDGFKTSVLTKNSAQMCFEIQNFPDFKGVMWAYIVSDINYIDKILYIIYNKFSNILHEYLSEHGEWHQSQDGNEQVKAKMVLKVQDLRALRALNTTPASYRPGHDQGLAYFSSDIGVLT